MRDLLALALREIKIKSEATKALRDQVLAIEGDRVIAEQLLESILADKEISNCANCDSRHFCNFFIACTYFELDSIERMKTYIEAAIKDFDRIGSEWNETFARWIYGEVLRTQGILLPARRELEHTIEMLENAAKKFRKEDKYEKRCQGDGIP